MEDLISIVLPVFNGEQFLKESIESVLNQTYHNWELIIIDDGSTDLTPQIAHDYTNIDDRIHYYSNKTNMHLPRSLNRGFKLSKGEYLTWTSDDNRYLPDALERMHDELVNNKANFVFASCQVINEEGDVIEYMLTGQDCLCQIIGQNIVGACFMYTRNAYIEIGEYNPEYSLVEDFDYWQRIYAKFGAVVIEDILYEYRWHSKTLTNTMSKYTFYNTLEKMLLKNYLLFIKPDFKSKYYFYRALYKCRKCLDDKKNPYRRKYSLYSFYQFLTFRIPNKISKILHVKNNHPIKNRGER